MKKNKKQKNKIYILIIILVIFIGVFIFLKKPASQPITNNSIVSTDTSRKFYSKTLKFEIDVPAGFQVEDKYSTILLANSSGNIRIGSIGTNYNNLEEYINDLGKKNKLEFKNKESLTINGLSAIKVIVHPINNNLDETTYFIYSEYSVYHLSTEKPALYNNLDIIAQSFKYTP